MTLFAALLGVVTVLPLARGVAFGGPAPTPIKSEPGRAVGSFAPDPTKGPSVGELRKRSSFDAETCGFIDGDYASYMTCNSFGATCMLYTSGSVGMAGCCTGSDTQSCGWVSSCVDYEAYTSSSCDSDCMANAFVQKCTNAAYPYCHTWTYPDAKVADYGCTDTSTGVQTVRFSGTYSLGSGTTISLSTLSGNAVDLEASDPSDSFTTSSSGSSGYGSSYGKKSKKKVPVALIAGAVIGALVLLFIAVAVVIFICVKKKKSRQLAANQQAIAAAQANRPQSAYPPPQPPMQQQAQPGAPPMPPQTPQPQYNGYFPPQGQQDQKFNPPSQVHEYGVPSPVSNPSTPAPAYAQPYYAAPNAAPPIPTQSPAPYPTRDPTPGAHEVDSTSAPQPQTFQPAHGQNNVYEMGVR